MHVTLHAPYAHGRNMILAGSLELATGDELRIEAELTPETVRRLKQGGGNYARRVLAWAKEHVTLQGDWDFGPFGKAAAAVLARTGMHPVVNAPAVPAGKAIAAAAANGREDLIVQLPASAQAQAELVLEARKVFDARDCYGLLNYLRLSAVRGDKRARLLLGALHDSGVCCCNKRQIRNRYDLGKAIERPPAEIPAQIATATSDAMAARSRQAINQGLRLSGRTEQVGTPS